MNNIKSLYEKIMQSVSKEVKRILNEDIQKFNPVDYEDDEHDIIDQDTVQTLSYTYCPRSRDELDEIIGKRIKENPKNPYLLDIDTSKIYNMTDLFTFCEQKEQIVRLNLSTWNISNVISMNHMFGRCESLKELDLS